MTGRERIIKALHHQKTDRVPVDIGGTLCSGAHVSTVAKLRQALGLAKPGERVKVSEPYQMLGEIDTEPLNALELDVVNVPSPKTLFGFANENFKPWRTFDGTDVLVSEHFNTNPEPDGSVLMYPGGDRSVPPSGKMPEGGFYFDSIVRQPPIDEEKLNPKDNMEEFVPISDEDLEYYRTQVDRLYRETDLALAAGFP